MVVYMGSVHLTVSVPVEMAEWLKKSPEGVSQTIQRLVGGEILRSGGAKTDLSGTIKEVMAEEDFEILKGKYYAWAKANKEENNKHREEVGRAFSTIGRLVNPEYIRALVMSAKKKGLIE